jgi:hypothetical protein
MKAKYAALHRADTWGTLALVMCVIGCAPADPPAPTTGPLPPGVTSNPSQFLQQTEALVADQSKTHFRWRPCQGAGGGCSVSVKIEALYTHPIDHENPPDSGMIAGRLTNLSATHNERLYGLRPSTQAKYLVWVDRRPGTNQTRWTLLSVPTSPAGGRQVTTAHQETLEVCHLLAPGESPTADIDFAEYKHPGFAETHPCRLVVDNAEHTARHASAFTIQPLVQLIGRFVKRGSPALPPAGPAWFGCTDGCCR